VARTKVCRILVKQPFEKNWKAEEMGTVARRKTFWTQVVTIGG
jgi:hypothetical protein